MKQSSPLSEKVGPDLDLNGLLHPAQAFADPQDVVGDPDLTLDEKRAILASWASDTCALEASPALRRAPGSSVSVSINAILKALCALDREAHSAAADRPQQKRQRGSIEVSREERRPQHRSRTPGSLH